MADAKGSALPAGGALAGPEKIFGLDGMVNKSWLASQLAAYIIALVSDGAPAELDTLSKLAAALGGDPDFATTVATSLSSKQTLDDDLTAIAALAPANDDIIQRKAGGWVARTMAQLRVDLGFPVDRRFVVPADAGTTNIAASDNFEIVTNFNHTSGIASHTINLPTMVDGQKITLRFRQAVTTVTINPPSGVTFLSTLATFAQNARATWEYDAANALLWRAD